MYRNQILCGNSLSLLKTIPSKTVNCSVSSPPYFQQRNYLVQGQLGMESHFDEYISNLCDIYDEVYRVLTDDGCIFVNLGDTYGTKSGNMGKNASDQPKNPRITESVSFEQTDFKMHKCLLMIPERFAIEMTRRGWILRNQIIWHKPNQMPQSAKDRFTVDFEKVFFFVKSKKYYFNADAVKEPALTKEKRPFGIVREREFEYDSKASVIREQLGHKNLQEKGQTNHSFHERRAEGLPDKSYESRNKRSVWSINTKPYKGAHFASFPEALVEPMILACCPVGGLVCDPFFGSGTTGLVANRLGRDYLGLELNPEYVELAKSRIVGK